MQNRQLNKVEIRLIQSRAREKQIEYCKLNDIIGSVRRSTGMGIFGKDKREIICMYQYIFSI